MVIFESNMNNRLWPLSVVFLITLFVGCTKDKYSGEFPLSDELKFLLPASDISTYINNDSIINTVTLSFIDNYYFSDTWDTDDGGVGGIIEYTGDFETYIKNYTSDLFNINYRIFVDKYGDLQQDILDITIESNFNKDEISVYIEMPLKDYQDRGYEPNIEFADSLIVNSVKLFEVYFIESNGLMYYLQKDKGLVGFEFDDDFWMLEDE